VAGHKKKLLLINPRGPKAGFMRSRFSSWPPLGLAYVAAATPPDWEIEIVDEDHEAIPSGPVDLVGITAFSSRINRAYELARTYRAKGAKVVLGGIHASMAPDEAVHYADAVVIGEAENIWATVVTDFENGRLSQRYQGPVVDLSKPRPLPRHDLLRSNYFWDSIQTSRGCPFNCSFCSVSKYLGKEYRKREAEDCMEELKSLKRRWVLFVDDNLVGHTNEQRAMAEELFSRMIENKLKKKFWMQTSINAADNERVIRLAAKAGCVSVFIGFETTSEDSLRAMKKGINLKVGVDKYRNVVRAFHKHGIGVMGGFVMGNDHESAAYYRQIAEFMVDAAVDVCQVSFLTPYPGTSFMDEVLRDDRLLCKGFPQDWDKFNFSNLVQRPSGISVEEVYEGVNYVKGKLYAFPAYQIRMTKAFFSVRGNWASLYFTYKFNNVFREAYFHANYYKNVKRLAESRGPKAS
jgi:radical SAM superfamily enzyme YgiQ (UPF0313 family)